MKIRLMILLVFIGFSVKSNAQLSSITVNTDGRVGIGTSSPTAELTVKGKIITSGLKVVELSSIPDYVFKKDYRLMPLLEVDNFVKQNYHLPEVPSEKQFLESGMNVAEISLLLLKKIEELTLYIIEQDKEIECLKGALNKQQGED